MHSVCTSLPSLGPSSSNPSGPTKLYPSFNFSAFQSLTAVAVACFPRHRNRDTSLPLYADLFILVVCETGPDIRVRIRRIVIRVRVRHTAIRVRVVVRAVNHTACGKLHHFGCKVTELTRTMSRQVIRTAKEWLQCHRRQWW